MDINVENLAKLTGLATPKENVNLSNIDFYSLASASPDNIGLSEFESDLKNLDYGSLINKYNKEDVDAAIQAQLSGVSNYIYDNLQNRDTLNIAKDTAVGLGQGVVGGVGSLLGLGASVLNEDLGTAIAQGTNNLTQGLQELKSDELQRMQRASNARSTMLDRESEALYQKDLREGSSLKANLRKLGRDVLNTASNIASEGAIAADIAAQGAGSLLVGGPTSKAVRGLAEAAQLAKAKALGNLNSITRAQIAKNTAEMNAWVPTTMALEGGGGYASGVQDVMDMPLSTLNQNPDFVSRVQELINQNVSESKAIEQARIELADSVGKSTAGIAAVTAAGLSKFSKWAEAPFKPNTLSGRVGNVASETFEESAQGVGTQMGQNLAVQMLADANRNIVDDVGRNIVEGAVGGALSSAPIQGIGIVGDTLSKVRESAKDSRRESTNIDDTNISSLNLDSLSNDVDNSLDSIFNAEPSSEDSTQENSIETTSTELPEETSVSTNDDIEDAVQKSQEKSKLEEEKELVNKSIFISENDLENISDRSKQIISDNNSNNSRIRAISNLVKAKNSAKTQEEKDEYTLDIFNLVKSFMEYSENFEESEYVKSIPENSNEAKYLNNTKEIITNILENTSFKAELSSAVTRISELNKKNLTQDNMNTSEGKQVIRATLAQLSVDPTKVNVKNAYILSKSSVVPENIKKALSIAIGIIRENSVRAKSKKELSEEERVNYEIISEEKGGKHNKDQISSKRYLKDLINGITTNNSALIKKTVSNFNGFLEHLSNKFDAAKQSLENGGKEIAYTAYSAKDKMSYQAKLSINSSGLAKAISDDYGSIKKIVDNINNAFPNIRLKQLDSKEISETDIKAFKEKRVKVIEEKNKAFNEGKVVKTKKKESTTTSKESNAKKSSSTSKPIVKNEDSSKKVVKNNKSKTIIKPVQYSKTIKEEANIKEELKKYIKNNSTKDSLVQLNEQALAQTEELGLSKNIVSKNGKYYLPKNILDNPIEDNLSGRDITDEEMNQLGNPIEFEFSSGKKEEGTLIELNDNKVVIYNNKAYPFNSISSFKKSVPEIVNIIIKKEPSIISQLIESVRDRFKQAFSFNDSIKSEFRKVKQPSKLIKSLINSDNSEKYSSEFKKDFNKLIEGNSSFISEIKSNLNSELQEFLNKTNIATKETNLQNLLNSGIISTAITGKFLNLVSNENGKYQFNEYLLDLAVLATVDWLLTTSNTYKNNDIRDVLSTLNLNRSELSNEDKFNYDSSLPGSFLTLNLTNNIKKFWGVSTNKDAPSGLSDAIIGSLASSILDIIKNNKDFNIINEVKIPMKVGNKLTKISQYKINIKESKLFKDSSLLENRNFLKEIIMETSERISYYEDDILPEPSKKVLHTDISTTKTEQEVLERANNTKYYPNNLTMSFVKSIGNKGFKKLLGIDTEDQTLNKEHKAILDSRALVIDAAYDDFISSIRDITLRANASNKSPLDVIRKFAFTIASQGRLQEVNPNGPVSNKLTRILFRATKSTLDLTSPENYDLYMSAIGQALGVKIGRNSFEETRVKTEEILKNLEPAINVLKAWDKNNSNKDFNSEDLTSFSEKDINTIRDTFNKAGMLGAITPEVIHVLLDYARYKNLKESNPDALKKYTTYVSIEADGIAHGTIATLMLAAGIPNLDWITSVARGGISIGSHKNNADSFKEVGKEDFYSYGGKNISKEIQNTFKNVSDKTVKSIAARTLRIFGNVFGSNIDYLALTGLEDREVGTSLDIPRDIVKTVIMTLNYGSGITGITNNIESFLVDAIYSKISSAIEYKKNNPDLAIEQCFYPNDTLEIAKNKFENFKKDLLEITSSNIYKDYKNDSLKVLIRNRKNTPKEFSDISKLGSSIEELENFNLDSYQLSKLEQNIKFVLSYPAQQGTITAMGNTAGTMNNIRDGSSIISSIYAAIYANEYSKYLENKSKIDSSSEELQFRSHYGISNTERKSFKESLKGWNPLVFNGMHYLRIPKYSREIQSNRPQAQGINSSGNFNYVPSDMIPQPAGVSLLPETVIEMGDVKMVNFLLLNNSFNTNNVFDGIEASLTEAKDVGLAANKAMAEAYKSNILTPFNKAFETFLTTFKDNLNQLEDALNNKEVKDTLIDNIFGLLEDKSTVEELKNLPSKELTEKLLNYAIATFNTSKDTELQIQARLNALKEVPVTVDNMSALNVGFNNSINESSLSEEEQRNNFISKAVENYAHMKKTFKPMSYTDPSLSDISEEVKDTSPVINAKEINITKEYFDKLFGVNSKGESYLSSSQKAIFKPLIDQISKLGLKLYIGNSDDLVKKASENGDNIPTNAKVLNGWYSVGSKNIYLNSESNGDKIETLLHELIHANTATKIYDYYINQKASAGTAIAINNLELMMNQLITDFINSPKCIGLPYILNLINQLNLVKNEDGTYSLPEISSPEEKAERLCEFIAYVQSNKNLIEKLKLHKVPKTLLDKLKEFYQKLKIFIFGIKTSNISDSYYSNIKFNMQILFKDDSLSSNTTSKILASVNRIENSDPRLTYLVNKFGSIIQKALSSNDPREVTFKTLKAHVNNAYNFAIQAQANGFTMTSDQANAFVYIFDGISLASKLNSPSLIKAQELYTHIINNLDTKLINNDMFNFLVQKGKRDKTQAFPLFIALASVHPVLREAISKIEVPSKLRSANKNTLDKTIDNIGYNLLDHFDNYLLDSKMSNDMLQSLDNIIENINRIDTTTNIREKELNILENLDKKTSEFISELGENSKDLSLSDRNKFTKYKNILLATLNNPDLVKKNLISILNTMEISSTLNQLFRDVIGTDAKGKRLEAIIKQAKALVQQVRQRYRTVIPSAIKEQFSENVSSKDYSLMFKAFANTDISIISNGDPKFTSKVFKNLNVLNGEYQRCLNKISSVAKKNTPLILKKAEELAEYMVNKKVSPNLLRNAYAIANLYGIQRVERYTIDREFIIAINKLVSIKALRKLSKEERDRISELFDTEPNGMKVILETLYSAESVENKENIPELSKINGYKGYVPSELESSQTVRVVLKDSIESKNLSDLGYVKVDSNDVFDYYYLDINTSGIFSQGGFQNIISSVYGVDPKTGRTISPGTMMITDKALIRKYAKSNNVIPIYNGEGKIIALESVPTDKLNNLIKKNTNLPEMLGAQIGRQFEEIKAEEFNKNLREHLYSMYINDPNKKEYINIFDIKDPVIKNSVNIISGNNREEIAKLFGIENFLPIRRDLIEEVIGIREASIGDFWTGNTRWSPKIQQIVKDIFELLLGKGAYVKLLKTEAIIQKGAAYARNWIVIKNPIVIFGNITSNVIQLISNGVPINKIVPLTIKYIRELEQFTRVENEIARLKVQRALAKTPRERSAINATISAKEAIKVKLDIYPLIQAGEYSSIADIGVKPEEVEFTFGKIGNYLEAQVDKLPDGIKQAGKYAIITKDTSLYQALNKTVQYGDLIAKAILFEHLTNKKDPYTKEEALDIIRDEFVNYDLQTGRTRGYLENIGLLWFYNYKLRALKSAVALIRRNPLFALIGMTMPMLSLLDGVGTVFTDNILTKLFDGGFLSTFGPRMFTEIPFLSPLENILA